MGVSRRPGNAPTVTSAPSPAPSRQIDDHPPESYNPAATAEHERLVLDAGGVILRYGYFYGPDTWYPDELPPAPRVQIDDAARRTVEALDAPAGASPWRHEREGIGSRNRRYTPRSNDQQHS